MFLPVIVLIIGVVIALWAMLAVAHVAFALLFALVPWAILGLVAGWIAGKVVRSPNGLFGDILVGIAGSVLGGALFSIFFHVHTGGILSPTHLIVSTLGAILLLVVMRAFRGPAIARRA